MHTYLDITNGNVIPRCFYLPLILAQLVPMLESKDSPVEFQVNSMPYLVCSGLGQCAYIRILVSFSQVPTMGTRGL